jgi:CO/xanthine dehydrogenase FAD-binding subunit
MEVKIKNYYKTSNLKDAYKMLQEDKQNIIIGGGAWLKLTNKNVETAIDITPANLNEIIETNDSIEIGAMTSLHQIEINKGLQSHCNGILCEAISHIMGMGIRNIATIGGSIMGKYSFSDILTPLLVMDTSLVFHNYGEISLEEFMSIKRFDKDILVKVKIKKDNCRGYFHKVQKTALDFAVINIAVSKKENIRIFVGSRPSIATEPLKAVEYINNQKEVNDEVIATTASLAANELKLGSNSRAGSEYRKSLVEVYIKRGLKEVMSNEN